MTEAALLVTVTVRLGLERRLELRVIFQVTVITVGPMEKAVHVRLAACGNT